MINGLGVLGWGVGGIEAEAAMLGQPVSMLIPQVVGVKLTRHAARRRDCDRSRAHRSPKCCASTAWSGKFVEFFGPGLAGPAAGRSRHHRQHGAGVRRDLRHFPDRRRDACATCASPAAPTSRSRWSRPTPRSRECSTTQKTPEAQYSEVLALDLATVEPSLAGPKRPQDRVALSNAGESFRQASAFADQAESQAGTA